MAAKKAPVRNGCLFFGAPEGTRTPDLLIRSQTLYPAELRAHFAAHQQRILFYHHLRSLSIVFSKGTTMKGKNITDFYPQKMYMLKAKRKIFSAEYGIQFHNTFFLQDPPYDDAVSLMLGIESRISAFFQKRLGFFQSEPHGYGKT